jgi:hypothetical protein
MKCQGLLEADVPRRLDKADRSLHKMEFITILQPDWIKKTILQLEFFQGIK